MKGYLAVALTAVVMLSVVRFSATITPRPSDYSAGRTAKRAAKAASRAHERTEPRASQQAEWLRGALKRGRLGGVRAADLGHGYGPETFRVPCTDAEWAAAATAVYRNTSSSLLLHRGESSAAALADVKSLRHGTGDDSFLEGRGCEAGLRGLLAFRRAQLSRTCRHAIFYSGESLAEPVVEICLDQNPLRGNCTVFSIGIAYNFLFDDMMNDRGCRVYSFDPSMNMPETLRREAPISKFYPLGIAAFDGKVKGAGTFYADSRSPHLSFEVRKLETLMAMVGVDKIDVLRTDVEGAEWELLKAWHVSNTWRLFDQLSIEMHIEMATPFPDLPEWRLIADTFSQVPYPPSAMTPNGFAGYLYERPPVMAAMRKAAEVSFVKGTYRARAEVTQAFWRRWGFEQNLENERPPEARLGRYATSRDALHFIKTLLTWVQRTDCLVGLQVTEEDAPARVCTRPGLRAAGECVVYILSERATATHRSLASLLYDEAQCTIIEFRVESANSGSAYGDAPQQGGDVPPPASNSTGAAGGGEPPYAVRYVTEEDVVDPTWLAQTMHRRGHRLVDVMRMDLGPVLTPRVLAAWNAHYRSGGGERGVPITTPFENLSQLSLRIHVLEDLANVQALAIALAQHPAHFVSVYHSALGEIVRHPSGTACTYELSYIARRMYMGRQQRAGHDPTAPRTAQTLRDGRRQRPEGGPGREDRRRLPGGAALRGINRLVP